MNSIHALKTIGITPHDQFRPRMSGLHPKSNRQSLDAYSEAQALHTEPGPSLVKPGMLAP